MLLKKVAHIFEINILGICRRKKTFRLLLSRARLITSICRIVGIITYQGRKWYLSRIFSRNWGIAICNKFPIPRKFYSSDVYWNVGKVDSKRSELPSIWWQPIYRSFLEYQMSLKRWWTDRSFQSCCCIIIFLALRLLRIRVIYAGS